MKKGIVILLLALAVIVLISPGIVGRLAERSMDENLDWAATETNEVTITSQGFDRGWFSSEGQHRVELRDGELRDALMYMVDDNGRIDLPALIIDTRIDHGLVPVTSMAREKGSLAPGLGRAVSTLHDAFEPPVGAAHDAIFVTRQTVRRPASLETEGQWRWIVSAVVSIIWRWSRRFSWGRGR